MGNGCGWMMGCKRIVGDGCGWMMDYAMASYVMDYGCDSEYRRFCVMDAIG